MPPTDQPREPREVRQHLGNFLRTEAAIREAQRRERLELWHQNDGRRGETIRALEAIEAEAAADALRERDEAVRLLGELVVVIGDCTCDPAYRDRDLADPLCQHCQALPEVDDARTFLRRFEGEPG